MTIVVHHHGYTSTYRDASHVLGCWTSLMFIDNAGRRITVYLTPSTAIEVIDDEL